MNEKLKTVIFIAILFSIMGLLRCNNPVVINDCVGIVCSEDEDR
jgi:hypothetical protein